MDYNDLLWISMENEEKFHWQFDFANLANNLN